jgi:hypothetical protein
VDVTSRVLTIEEVKQKMKDIRAAAVHYGGVVHCGERGRDELVIVSSRKWDEVTRMPGAHEAGGRAEDPYAVFGRALQDGRIGGREAGPEPRRRIPGLATESGLPLEDMIALGADTRSPRHRRLES